MDGSGEGAQVPAIAASSFPLTMTQSCVILHQQVLAGMRLLALSAPGSFGAPRGFVVQKVCSGDQLVEGDVV